MTQIIPLPRTPIHIRPATIEDIPFIDSLQKVHRKQVGFMPKGQLEGKIADGHVLVAEDRRSEFGVRCSGKDDPNAERRNPSAEPAGYIISVDRYHKHDNVGIIYQLNVAPARQRGFIGMALLKAVFDRAAYGCRLFCCWCAQDIQANRFWEAMGFVPLAFRTGGAGSAKKSRVHIFWQKRIRAGDTRTPWWIPCETGGGAIRENRIVLPIPP